MALRIEGKTEKEDAVRSRNQGTKKGPVMHQTVNRAHGAVM